MNKFKLIVFMWILFIKIRVVAQMFMYPKFLWNLIEFFERCRIFWRLLPFSIAWSIARSSAWRCTVIANSRWASNFKFEHYTTNKNVFGFVQALSYNPQSAFRNIDIYLELRQYNIYNVFSCEGCYPFPKNLTFTTSLAIV